MVCGRLSHIPMSLRARTSVLDMRQVEKVMDCLVGWGFDLEELDSSGNDTSDHNTVGAMIFRGLLYGDSCS